MEMTALVVDDEPFARVLLCGLLKAQQVNVVGEAGDVAEALRLAEEARPDVAFLDIQMPGMSGMQIADVMSHLESPPLIVFVTGYSEFAISAFERNALDYLLKPVSPDRLAQTLGRARLRLQDAESRSEMMKSVSAEASAEQPRIRRLPIRDDYMVRLIRVEDMICAEARDKRVFITTSGGEFRTYYTLKQLEAILPRDEFVRIHDSFIVNIEVIEELHFLGNHAYEVRLSNNRRLPVARTRYSELQRRLGIE
ncbi:MAG: LytR/AlgR family response regulator transcription factor [Capsulimonadaceae bacterium]